MGRTLYVESRYGGFGYFSPLIGNSDEPFQQDTGTRVSTGGDRRTQTDRDRRQWTTAATYFKDNNYIGNAVTPSSNPGYPNSPNEALYSNGRDGANRFTLWDVKAHATWEAPRGIRVTPVLRVQAGQPYGRLLQVSAQASCGCFFSGAVMVEPIDTRRMDTASVLDVRTETTVPLGGRYRARLFFDLFNLLNSAAGDVISFTAGTAFELPTSVVAPRVGRVGMRLMW